MHTQTMLDNQVIKKVFIEILEALSGKERNVIERRIGLYGDKETLQSIWNTYSITRERVRQIEDAWIKKIGRIIKWTNLISIQDKSREILALHWDVLLKKRLINALIKELELSAKTVDAGILEVIIQSDFEIKKSKPRRTVKTYFFLPQISRKQIDSVHTEALRILNKRKDVMDRKSLYEMLHMKLKPSFGDLRTVFIDSSLDLFKDIVKWEETLIWLERWKILNPKTLKDKAIYVLKKEKVPMHFVDIANKIVDYLGWKVKVNTIHNELIRNEEFVLVWRWIYALKEWWVKAGTVLDVIIDIMKKNREPMTTDEIINKVLKLRLVKRTTIYMNLQNKKIIERVWRNYYKLRDDVQ